MFAAASGRGYTGAAACKPCHPAQYAVQSATAHAGALSYSKPDQPGKWAFGAGSQAITFVSRTDRDNYREHGESWYRSLRGYALTPGHKDRAGELYRIFDPSAAILRCFSCHSTGPVALDAQEEIVPSEPGVRCEACHGPGADHVRDPKRNPVRNPKALSAAAINELCGACHRMPVPATAATDLHNPWNARHQPLLLAKSACFRKSGGRLTCFTCHAPHAPVETDLTAYNAACEDCHAAPKHSRPVAGKACASCHMPKAHPQPGLEFANHRIAVYRQ